MKVLSQVLLEEYKMLKLFNDEDCAAIPQDGRGIKENEKAEDDAAKVVKEVADKSKSDDPDERAEESRDQFVSESQPEYRKLEIIRKRIHAKNSNERPSALCFSGGGIRSATFCLGVMQALAKNGLLSKFDYLSTVSGGGYIGSWFSAWLYREGNMDKIDSALSRSGGYPYLFGLNDFNVNFTGELDDVKNDLKVLKANLDKNKNFFGSPELDKLSGRIERLLNSKVERNEIREFGKDLCRELNRIILNEHRESGRLRSRVDRILRLRSKVNRNLAVANADMTDRWRQRIKIKRQIIEKRLKPTVKPLYEFENVEPPQITYLRSYSNYLSPRIGLFTIDTWTLIAIYLRNLLLNLTVSLPLIAAFLMLPRLFLAILDSELKNYAVYFFIAMVISGGFSFAAMIAMRPSLKRFSWIDQHYKIDEITGTLKSAGKKFLWLCWMPLVVATFCGTLFWVWRIKDVKFSSPYLSSDAYENVKQIGFVLLYEGGLLLGGLIYLFGVFLYLLLRWIKKTKVTANVNDRDQPVNNEVKPRINFFREIATAIIGGIIGGLSLYLFAYLLEMLENNRYFPSVTPNAFYLCFGPPLFLIAALLATMFFVGIAGKIYDDMDREWLSRFSAWVMITIVGWSVFSFIALFGPEIYKPRLWDRFLGKSSRFDYQNVATLLGAISGLITLLLGFSSKSPATEEREAKTITGTLLKFAPIIVAPLFALFLAATISRGTELLLNYVNPRFANQVVGRTPSTPDLVQSTFIIFNSESLYLLFWLIIFIAVGCVMGLFVNINKFSLHALYRERLIRAYLGASRTEKRVETANSFTDLDDQDNVELYRLHVQKPFHVLNMTLNLGKSNNLRWQNRKAESFTATPLHCGSSNMGEGNGCYRDTELYARGGSNKQAITLGTAAAISGAAVSPNMGYYTQSVPVSLLMALFNIRLGWWLGNPGPTGNNTFKKSAPTFSPNLFKNEAFGDTIDTNPFVYLSDGGHFDNLGLYEMVLRRCHFILACDAGADLKFGFSDLGTAIHKIRVDMGIPIEFVENQSPVEGRNCAIARIRYSAVDRNKPNEDGFLIYIKPTLDGDEPIDIVNYKSDNVDFPHETTGDQFYSEKQFESYRSLGIHMIDSICGVKGKSTCNDFAGFISSAEQYLAGKNAESNPK